jgi:outer membrane receptor protein involved in Fe transport
VRRRESPLTDLAAQPQVAAMLASRASRILPALSVWMLAATDVHAQPSPTTAPELGTIIVTARRIPELAQNAPVALTVLSTERIHNYNVNSLEQVAAITPGLIITRGNSGSGADFSLRGIGSNYSSIGIEQSVAVVVDGVYYGQGRVIDEGFVDLERIELLKGPQSLFFGKNSTAGVISITTANPTEDLEVKGRVGYEVISRNPSAEMVMSGPLTDSLGLRFVAAGQKMIDGYVRNRANAGTYATFDAATGALTPHTVPAPSDRDLPDESFALGRLTALYQPAEDFQVSLKATVDHNEQGGTSWNDRLWKCPLGTSAFPGSAGESCDDTFNISQNPAPRDIAATRKDMGREDGELYTRYDSYSFTAQADKQWSPMTLTAVSNYQRFRYSSNSDYDFTSVPAIWSDQHNTHRAFSQEVRARTRFEAPLNVLLGVYYQDTQANFAQAAVFFGSENTAAPDPANRYVSVSKSSATDGRTWAGYGQVIWTFAADWELTAGARYTEEKKDSFFLQPYVNPFFASLYAENHRLAARQEFSDTSPEATLSWKPQESLLLYVAYKTGYKSGGFSNSADDVVGGAGVANLAFEPETVEGAETGFKALLLDRQVNVAVNVYRYRYSDLQVDFFNAQNFALITTNAGSAISEGVELEGEYRPARIDGLRLRSALAYNRARYGHYIGPCYAGQTQAQGCTIAGNVALQNLGGKPTADSPRWSGMLGIDHDRQIGTSLLLGWSTDLRYSDNYSVNPFAQPLDRQSSYVNVDAAIRLRTLDNRWKLEAIGKNLTNNFVVTYASDLPSTGTPPGGATGQLADQFALFAPARSVTLQLTYQY